MDVNKANFSIGVHWNENTAVRREKITDWSALPKPANVDKMVLNLPVSETKYIRNEFYRHEPNDDSVGQCSTYTVRTLTFADGSTITGSHQDYSFAIKIGQFERLFANSGTDMNEIDNAVEETWIYKERSLDKTAFSLSSESLIAGKDFAVDEKLGLNALNTEYKYAAASQTVGTVNRKDGAIQTYVHNAAIGEITGKTDISVSQSTAAASGDNEKAAGLLELLLAIKSPAADNAAGLLYYNIK